jgi:hypothetical protein
LTTFDLGESGTVVGLSDTDAVTINVSYRLLHKRRGMIVTERRITPMCRR